MVICPGRRSPRPSPAGRLRERARGRLSHPCDRSIIMTALGPGAPIGSRQDPDGSRQDGVWSTTTEHYVRSTATEYSQPHNGDKMGPAGYTAPISWDTGSLKCCRMQKLCRNGRVQDQRGNELTNAKRSQAVDQGFLPCTD